MITLYGNDNYIKSEEESTKYVTDYIDLSLSGYRYILNISLFKKNMPT
jgi:hypothetical protein